MNKLFFSTLGVVLSVTLLLSGCKSKDADAVESQEERNSGVSESSVQGGKLSFDCDLPTYISGCHVDIENMKDSVDLDMDISKLNLADLRILRNVFAAQQGYCFMDSFLRHIYCATSWYFERALEKAWSDTPVDVQYTEAQKKFIEKIKAREEELQKLNYNPLEGYLVNYNNICNIYQMTKADNEFKDLISRNGFAIVEELDVQLFHVYEKNDYSDFPSFVTTDMYLQLYHVYFDFLLRDLEKTKLMGELKSFATTMHCEMMNIARSASNPVIKDAAEYNATMYAIGLSLLTGNKNYEAPAKYKQYFDIEIEKVNKANDDFSEFLGFDSTPFMYSLFRPRGHYTRSDEFKRYFKSMMWFQYVPCCLDDDVQFGRAILSADVIKGNASLQKKYNSITEPITFIVGEPDNVSVMQLAREMKKSNKSADVILGSNSELKKFRSAIQKIADQQNRISPKQIVSCKDKINLMPQRYLADNEILQELVDVESPATMRPVPKGLDVLAAFGSDDAYKILIDEYNEDKNWPDYVKNFNGVKKTMKNVNWDVSMYNKWMQSLNSMLNKDSRYPYFMQTYQWAKKNINAALASWSELKHDCILYAEQPMGAECGGGEDLPEPILVGYVEPNLAYWNKAIELLDMTEKVLKTNGMFTENAKSITESMREKAQFLKSVSEKELEGKKLTENEYSQIKYIGSSFEWLTLDMLNADSENPAYEWYSITGTDRKVAVVADIYTANSFNNDNKSILYAATGNVNTIYVIVEIEGKLYLTRGAVLSYREFDIPLGNPRLTDEEWQDMLEKAPRYGVPEWIKEIIAPGELPKDNTMIFYSSGC